MKMNIRGLSYNDAKSRIAEIDSMDDVEFNDLINHWKINDVSVDSFDASYREFRESLISCFNSSLEEIGGKITRSNTYLLDLKMGIKLYELLNPKDKIP